MSSDKKLNQDLIWSMGSFFVIGFVGILLNVLIGKLYGAETLGVFNQIFAMLFIFGHIGTLGIHYSVLKYSAEFKHDIPKRNSVYTNALLIIVLFSIPFTLGLFYFGNFIEAIFNSSKIAEDWNYVVPAIVIFSFNKIIINFINGLRRIKLMSLMNALKFILYIVFLVYFYQVEEKSIVKLLAFSELIVFVVIFIICTPYLKFSLINKETLGKHLDYAKVTFWSGFLQNIETRVDVLMLGLFLSDSVVGVYSFAAMLIQGGYQIAVVFRTNFNPLITEFGANNQLNNISELMNKWKTKLYITAILIAVVAISIFKPFVQLATGKEEFQTGFLPFSILIVGLTIAAPYIPFNMIFVQLGKLREHIQLYVILVLINIFLNGVFIPIWGITGAALATALMYISFVFLLKNIASKKIGIKL